MTRRELLATAAGAGFAGPGRTSMGLDPYSFALRRQSSEALELLPFAHSLGAGGAQVSLKSFEPAYLQQVRELAARLELYVEVLGSLPKDDPAAFEALVRAAKQVGARAMRVVCLGGRRYETFSNLEDWKRFVAESRARIARAVPIVERHRLPLAIENHKDWTLQEMVRLLEEYSSEYLGACIDFGNNIALLDDPNELIEGLARYAFSTHIKDMAVEEYAEGFLLAEAPLGEGMLDLKRMVAAILRFRPQVKFSLEMITRDPLKIPCLTEKYWVTFPDRSGRYLARTLAMVRANRPRRPLPNLSALDAAARLQLEMDNVRRSLDYARRELGLTA